MPNIIKVDTKDKYRTLLTDVLPYELPLWLTNYYLYQQFKNSAHRTIYETISGLSFDDHNGVYIPLDYQISRGSNSNTRTISIMHPVAQLQVCNFYEEYDNLIKYYCTKSQYSLRHPSRVATKFYGKVLKGSKLSEGVENIDEERIASSSYFKYKKYSFLFRFFESYEYHKLEKQFHKMAQVDVSKCFPSIYTHSIGWATKNKRLAKLRPKGSFDERFDSLMQLTNYRETNGILVGPEVSRIFAEIIFQKIDLNLVDRLREKNYIATKDYDFKRYVDDYFIFYRSDEVKNAFIKALELSLLEYKMYLNEAKTIIASRPFATNISLAKHELRNVVNKCFKERYKENDTSTIEILKLARPDSKANKIISEVKIALAQHKVEYTSISNYLFSALVKRINIYLSDVSEIYPKDEHHLNWLLVDLDVIFFIHAMDIRIRTTDSLGKLVDNILKKITDWPNNYREIVYKKIFDNIKQAINIFINNSNSIEGLETLNLLIILSMLPDEYRLDIDKIKEYFAELDRSSETNDFYFRWITFMLYIESNEEYSSLNKELILKAETYLLNHEDMFKSSEYFMFYFDYLACPHIHEDIRKSMIKKVKAITIKQTRKQQGSEFVNFNIEVQSKHVLKHDFIVGWRDKQFLQNSLEKKEYIFAYN